MKVFRSVIAFPLLLLQISFALVSAGFRVISKWTMSLGNGSTRHLYAPIMKLRRRVVGEPTWKPIDLSIGVYPKSAKDKDALEAYATSISAKVIWPTEGDGPPMLWPCGMVGLVGDSVDAVAVVEEVDEGEDVKP